MLLPLFPLPNVVLFPDTLLPLHIFEPRYRQLIADLLARPEAERWIGMVLSARSAAGGRELLEPGCAGRLVAHEPLPDGRSNIVLAGETRFRIAREVSGKPYRQAIVEPLGEQIPSLDAERAEATHAELLRLAASVVGAAGGKAPIDLASLAGLGSPRRLPALVNRLAAQLDLPTLRQQTLLAEPPLARGEQVAGILRSRLKLLRTLAPYRHLAAHPDRN
ncbi:MAG: LON peptidase substrate-binding domain-containing protein [Thermoanaerobaculia bacterium]|nr:LON peptidase substrate-binding domain-containing protein [Thermoanaerobaculia bacterium]